MGNPRQSNGHRRRQVRAAVLAEETHCAICGTEVIIIGGLLATLLGIVALLSGFSTSNVWQVVPGSAFATLGLLALRRIA